MRIGELARRSGASVRSLRYYEEQGLVHSVRTPSGQRTYDDDAVARVELLRRLYAAGLNSETIRALLPCVDTPSRRVTDDSIAIMQREHDRVGEQIASLIATRQQLAHLIDAAAPYSSCNRSGRAQAVGS